MDPCDPRMQAGRLLQLRFHWREQGSSSYGFTGGSKVVAKPGLLGVLGYTKGAVLAVLVPLEVASL